MSRIHVETVIEAPVEQVWERFVDHERAKEWMPLSSSTLVRTGTPTRNGVGARRLYRSGPLKLYEDVVHFLPPFAMDYKLVRGLPGLGYHCGRCRLREVDGGVRLSWTVDLELKRFHPLRPLQPIIASQLKATLTKGLRRLKEQLEAS